MFKLRELCDIYFEKQADSIYEYLKINPLLEVRGSVLAFRYHFLQDYFSTLFVIDGVINNSQRPSFINATSKYSDGKSASYLDVVKYFREHHGVARCYDILQGLKSAYVKENSQKIERSISFLVHLLIDLHSPGSSKKELSEELFSCFVGRENGGTVSYLFIHGDALPLDFSNRKFTHCGFDGYSSLLNSNLDHAFFSYTTVDIETQDLSGYHITRDTFDSTCRIGRLSRFLEEGTTDAAKGQATNEELLRRFFWNFVENNSFVEKNLNDLVFPIDAMSSGSRFFREALSQHIIYLTKDNKKCGVTRAGEKVVHNFMTNNMLEASLYKILQKI